MIISNYAGSTQQGSGLIALHAEAYLASALETSEGDLTAALTDGMMLVSGLLCGATKSVLMQEKHRKLAKLVLAKMQRITRDTDTHCKQGAYPCFTS